MSRVFTNRLVSRRDSPDRSARSFELIGPLRNSSTNAKVSPFPGSSTPGTVPTASVSSIE